MDKQKRNDPLEYAGKARKYSTAGCVLAVCSALLGVAPYLFIWLAVRDAFYYFTRGTAANLWQWGALAVAFALGSMLLYFIGLMLCHLAAFRTAKNLRSAALHHLMELPLSYFSTHPSGTLRREIDECAAGTESYLAHQLPDLTAAKITPVAALLLLFVFDWRLGLLSLLPTVIALLFMIPMMGKKAMEQMQNYQTALGEMNGHAVEYVRGIPVVKTFQQSVFSFRRFHASIENYKKWAVDYTKSQRVPMCGYTVSINGTFALLIPVGILLLASAAAPEVFLLDFIFYILFTPFVATAFNKILWSSDQEMRAQDALRRIKAIINEPVLEDTQTPKHPADYSICAKDVTFTYPGAAAPALESVTFSVKQGQTIALVGPSGCGKSTMASLLARFFDVSEGAIKIGGVDVRQIPIAELTDRIAFVFQKNNLFHASLLDNIRAAKPDATDAEIQRAIDAAMCRDIVEKLPEGLDTMLGTKGVYLSVGEQQRIALARAILKDAPIIILDEATAFADPENEMKIQKAFEILMRGKTVVMIAHRLTTVQNADCIYVLQGGRLAEQGTHSELLLQNGLYEQMWRDYQQSVIWQVGKGAHNDHMVGKDLCPQ